MHRWHTAMSRVGHMAFVGMVRSGSTYTENALARIFEGVAVGELPGLWGVWSIPSRLCSCGNDVTKCPFWSTVSEHYPAIADPVVQKFMTTMNKSVLPIRKCVWWRQFGRNAKQPASVEAKYAEELRRLYTAISKAAAEQNYKVVVDSSKHPLWFHVANQAGALHKFTPRVAIRLIRHPHAVAWSLRNPQNPTESEGEGSPRQVVVELWKALPYWAIMNFASDCVTGGFAIRLQYEHLGDSDSSYISELKSAGFSSEKRTNATVACSHQLTGNPTRSSPKTRSFSRDERWRSRPMKLSERIAWILILPLLKRYGYNMNPPK